MSENPPDDTWPSFIQGLAPKKEEIQYTIGPYQVLKSVGKGGMGEILLAYDSKCGRRIALKKIRADLLEHQALHNRFLKEAKITCQLTHPAIMPIYTIEDENRVVYYTMPFVQGETLKQILRTTREQEKKGEALHHLGGSIPALIRIFITVCQAIAYAHAKGVLHRDIKPENIIVGEYGEVLILDWGLAKLKKETDEQMEQSEIPTQSDELTRPGKVVGTVSFMAPERALGQKASVLTEIYSLGVVLYQILTLRNPFQRGTLEEFRNNIDKEKLEDPTTVAPYRDVPRLLSTIAMKCLERDSAKRYADVNELLMELENYIEGRSEWFQIAKLDIYQKENWEFQENILIAEHIAITRGPEIAEWVSLMISKASFTENTKIETRIKIGNKGYGVGFLMSIPEAAERVHLNDGYCLWLGSDINKATKLLRSTVEVITAPDIYLERGIFYSIKIEKIDHNIYFYLNDTLQFSYISHLPLIGTHIGVLSRDADFTLEDFTIFVGSQNITVNCLAVPDAFLAHRDYTTALNEYRRIGYSFPGRAEGREAMFRAGITILEAAKAKSDLIQKERLYDEAFLEFEKLAKGPGAPLEYLGKAHIYQATQDIEEEIKCYELGFRKYPKHPLLPVLHEQLIFRMHEISRSQRKATYLFMLTALRHLPQAIKSMYTKKLMSSLQKHWENLIFIEKSQEATLSDTLKNLDFRTHLAFWLANPYALVEIFNELLKVEKLNVTLLANNLFCLIELGALKLAKDKFDELPAQVQQLDQLKLMGDFLQGDFEKYFLKKDFSSAEFRFVFHLIERDLFASQNALTNKIFTALKKAQVPKPFLSLLESYQIWAHLLNSNWEKAASLLHSHPLTTLTQDQSLLFTLYGCWLGAVEGREIAKIHFSAVLDVSYPRSWTLLSHYVTSKISDTGFWGHQAFMWEKRQLYRQLDLWYTCIGDKQAKLLAKEKEQQQYLDPNCLEG